MDVLANPWRGLGLPTHPTLASGEVIADPSDALALLARCPVAAATPLRDLGELADELEVAALSVKDESSRMGLGSFKALGAAHAIARQAAQVADAPAGPADEDRMAAALIGTVYACASAGNHGLSVAAGARVFGAQAVVYLPHAVPEGFAQRLREYGAKVVRAGDDYEASMAAVTADAAANGWVLLSDSSWAGYVEMPTRVMEGYLIMAAEIAHALDEPATHVMLQAGVGGLAAAVTAHLRARWGDAPTIVVVEPETAPALYASIEAGTPVRTPGPVTTMGRLDCKEPSHLALAELARHADHFVTVSDAEADDAVALLARHGIATTPSGAAGLAAVRSSGRERAALGLSATSRVLILITEGPEPPAGPTTAG
jgi:diaminopropionate ammonia-lyase